MRLIKSFLWIGIISGGLLSCTQELSDTGFLDEEDLLFSIAAYVDGSPEDFDHFRRIIEASGSYDALSSYNPNGNGFTFFLPTNSAVDAYIAETEAYSSIDELLANSAYCLHLVQYHLVNREIRTTEFPYGVLPDSTASGDYLTIGIEVTVDTSIYKVNNRAAIVDRNIETTNGYIHVIDRVLEPIIYSSFDWLLNQVDYSILTSLFEITGLKDTMGLTIHGPDGRITDNDYTVLAEPDSIYRKAGIMDVNDLVQLYATPGLEPDDPENGLYQFAAYHILEGIYFLDDMVSTMNYNTYAAAPVSIASGYDILINEGVDTFQVIYTQTDTAYIDYILPIYGSSNINTKTGAIHAINQVLEIFIPGISATLFEFYEEPQIQQAMNSPGTYEFEDQDLLRVLSWDGGAEKLIYHKSSGTETGARNKDYLLIEGDFSLEYKIPKVLPGLYELRLQVESTDAKNATIEIFLDGNKMGSSYNLTSGGTSTKPYKTIIVGTVDFTTYDVHSIRLESLIPGILNWDWISLIPKI